jgi:hypothetical protein
MTMEPGTTDRDAGVYRFGIMGTIAGATAIVLYLTRTFVAVPDVVAPYFFMLFGPCLVLAFIGWKPMMEYQGALLLAQVATVFGIIAGAVNMMFAVVQMNNLHYLNLKIAAAANTDAAIEWKRILYGVFTVQNGLNFTMDFFLDAAAFCYAAIMWHHPAFGRIVSLLSIVLVGPHFVMKLLTFPQPPAEAGMFDAGPLVGAWFTLATLTSLRWLLRYRKRA